MPRVDTKFTALRERHIKAALAELGEVFDAQFDEVKVRGFLSKRWDAILTDVVAKRNKATAGEVAQRVARVWDAKFDVGVMDAWLEINAEHVAGGINAATRADLDKSDADDPVEHVFGILLGFRAAVHAHGIVSTSVSFGAADAARASGAGAKQWQRHPGNSRSSHIALSGQTVGLDDAFSNGLRWPGDPRGSAADNANCRCSILVF